MTDSMQALVDGLGAQWMRDRAETQMTFGELIERLGQLPPDTPIAAGDPNSYRGYYSDIALDPTEISTAGELLAKCREMMGRTMTGYKGGEFPVHENVPVWVSPYGECSGDKLMSVDDDGTLNTRAEE